MDKSDQYYRKIIFEINTNQKNIKDVAKEYNTTETNILALLGKKQSRIDSINIVKIDSIITLHNYPGESLVGFPENLTAWGIIQHSNKIDKYLDILKTASENNEIPFRYYAMSLDRVLVHENKHQVYGTQGMSIKIMNEETGKIEDFNFIWPIENPEKVNQLRKKAGFTTSIKKNAKLIGIKYKEHPLDEILNLIEKQKKLLVIEKLSY